MWQADLGEVNVQWSEQGDEWSHHLDVALARQFTNWGRSLDHAEGGVEISLQNCGVTSVLRVLPASTGMTCQVLGEGDLGPVEVQVAPWRVAVREAEAAIGRTYDHFPWYAVLGPHPFLMNSQPDTRTLAGVTALGPVTLTPTGQHICEWLPGSDMRIGWRRRATTWPVFARGSEPSYDPITALQRARVPLRRACALLSLAMNDCWDVRLGPHPLPADQEPPPVAHHPHVLLEPDGTAPELGEDEGGGPPTGLDLPAEVAAAWPVLDANPELARAVEAFYEGMKLRSVHPSVAFMMYVVAIEAVGNGLEERTLCQCCPDCQAEVGAQRRFRLALAKAVPKKQVHSLSASAYRYRSLTAHQGQLHGPEASMGIPAYTTFQVEPTRAFRDEDVAEMRAASRGVLLWALANTADRADR